MTCLITLVTNAVNFAAEVFRLHRKLDRTRRVFVRRKLVAEINARVNAGSTA